MNIVVLSLLLLLVFSCCFALHMLLQQNKTKWPQTRACTFDFLGTHRNKLKRFVRSTGWPWCAVCHHLPDYRKSSTWGRLVILLMMHLNLRHERCESDWYNVQRHDSSCDPQVYMCKSPWSLQSWSFHRHLFMISTTVLQVTLLHLIPTASYIHPPQLGLKIYKEMAGDGLRRPIGWSSG